MTRKMEAVLDFDGNEPILYIDSVTLRRLADEMDAQGEATLENVPEVIAGDLIGKFYFLPHSDRKDNAKIARSFKLTL